MEKWLGLIKKIIPFDLYFTLGWVQAQRSRKPDLSEGEEKEVKQTAQLLSFGAGQLFAFGKSWALRWDLVHKRLLSAQAKTRTYSQKEIGTSSFDEAGWFFSIGMSYFFPKAKYR